MWLGLFPVKKVTFQPRFSTQQSWNGTTFPTFDPHFTQKCSVVLQLSVTNGTHEIGQNKKQRAPDAAHVCHDGPVVTRVREETWQFGHSLIFMGSRVKSTSSIKLLLLLFVEIDAVFGWTSQHSLVGAIGAEPIGAVGLYDVAGPSDIRVATGRLLISVDGACI